MSALIVVTGPPGAGKSTVAELLVGRFELSALVAGDAFFAMVDRGFIDPWTEAAHRQNEVVIAAAGAAAGRLAEGGYTVVFDGVIGPWFLDAFVAATGLGEVQYVILLPPEHVCLQRVGSRVGHGFSDPDAARHMYGEFAGAARTGLHVVRSTDSPDLIATTITDLLKTGTLRFSTTAGS
jgi:cytidylate kinase